MGEVRRADLAFLRYHGLTEWLVGQAIDLQPQPCTVESLPTLATLSTAVTSELASLTGLGLTSFFLHQHVGRVYAIGLAEIRSSVTRAALWASTITVRSTVTPGASAGTAKTLTPWVSSGSPAVRATTSRRSAT